MDKYFNLDQEFGKIILDYYVNSVLL